MDRVLQKTVRPFTPLKSIHRVRRGDVELIEQLDAKINTISRALKMVLVDLTNERQRYNETEYVVEACIVKICWRKWLYTQKVVPAP